MRIDSAIKAFSEKYDRDVFRSIDAISNDYSLRISDSSIKAFNLAESFQTFDQYLKGYASYKVENVNNPQASSQETIRESVRKFIDTQVFKECHVKYGDLPGFVTGYVDGVRTLLETVDEVKRNMVDADVDPEAIGDINEFTDMFMDRLHESFDPSMDRILWASGYNSKARLSASATAEKPKTPVFL